MSRSVAVALALALALAGGVATPLPAPAGAAGRAVLIALGDPVRVVDERGEVVWQGPEGRWSAWSPDGRRLAFTTVDGVAVVDLADGEVTPVGGFHGSALMPDWSPDGTRIAFSGYVDGDHREVFVAPASGCCARRVTSFAAGLGTGQVQWTADSRRLVVAVELDDDGIDFGDDLFLVDPRTGAASLVTGNVPGEVVSFDLRSTDDAVAVVAAEEEVGQRLWRVDADGSDAVRLGPAGGLVPFPAWSPDGRWIAYGEFDRVAVVRPDGTDLRLLGPLPTAYVTGPSWYPDSRRLAYVAVDSETVLAVGTSGTTRVLARTESADWPAVAPVFVPAG